MSSCISIVLQIATVVFCMFLYCLILHKIAKYDIQIVCYNQTISRVSYVTLTHYSDVIFGTMASQINTVAREFPAQMAGNAEMFLFDDMGNGTALCRHI